jgi:23S rRNA pseudouridine1911/1915/1917 synthase
VRDAASPLEPARLEVDELCAGERLDVALASHLGQTRNRVQAWIRAGAVSIGGCRVLRPSRELRVGDLVECREPEAEPPEQPLVPEAAELVVLWEDEDLVVLDKPASIAVHPGAGRAHGTLAHRLLHHYPEMSAVGHAMRPGIVHRLDLGTSGVMVVARTQEAYLRMSRAFAEREVEKHYEAVAYGTPREARGRISLAIGRDPRDRKRMAVSERGGREALTLYEVRAAARGLSWMEIDLKTGRTHQIRVHLKSIGHPLVGDPTYGEARWKAFPAERRKVLRDFARPALHSRRLAFLHPWTRERLEVSAPRPSDMLGLWNAVAGSAPPPDLR